MKSNKDENVVIHNTFMLYLMTIAKYVFPLLLFPYLTRVLTSDYYGIVTYMTSVVSYVSLIIDFGFNFSATRKIAQAKDNIERINQITANVIQAKVILAAASGLFVMILVPFVPLLKENLLVLVAYYLSTAILAFLPDFVYRGLEQMQGITIRYVLSKIITTILTLLVVKGPEDLIFVPIFNGVGNLFSILVTWIHLNKNFNVKFLLRKWRESLTELKESFVFFVSTFASTAFTLANTILMGFVDMSTSDIACWGVAFQLISVVMSLYEPITSSLYPRMVSAKKLKLLKMAICLVLPLIVVGLVICWVGAEFFVEIVSGPGYEKAVWVFRLMLPVLLFTYPAQVLGFPALAPVHQEKYATRATVIAAVFHILGLILLIVFNQFLLLNIAVLRSITELIFMCVRVYYFSRIRGYYNECKQ